MAKRKKKAAKKKKTAKKTKKKVSRKAKKKTKKKAKKKAAVKRKAATKKPAKKKTKKKAKKKAASRTAKKTKTVKKKSTGRSKPANKKRKAPGLKIVNTAKTDESAIAQLSADAGKASRHLKVGDKAPDFSLPDQNGRPVSLEDFKGKTVVLYFYPKDDTPGCTKEACEFRDHLPRFQNSDAIVFGVSFDDGPSHQRFIEKYNLNFDLLSDTEKEVSEKYGVYVQKNMYGKTYMGIERSTFVINKEGYIAEIFRKVKVEGHSVEVLEAIQKVA